MARTFIYDGSSISIKDILEFLKENNYKYGKYRGMDGDLQFKIQNSYIYIRIFFTKNEYTGLGDIYWDDFDLRYGMEMGGWDKKTRLRNIEDQKERGYQILTPADYEKDKKLYQKLKRKFQMKKDEKPGKKIKDLDWICEQVGVEMPKKKFWEVWKK